MDVAQSRHILGCQRAGSDANEVEHSLSSDRRKYSGRVVHLDSDVPLRFFSSSSNVGGEAP